MFRQRNPGLLLSTLVGVYMQGQLQKNYHKEKKVIIDIYGEEKQMLEFKAAPNKKSSLNIYVAQAPRRCRFRFLCEQKKCFARYQSFLSNLIHLQSFIIQESFGSSLYSLHYSTATFVQHCWGIPLVKSEILFSFRPVMSVQCQLQLFVSLRKPQT